MTKEVTIIEIKDPAIKKGVYRIKKCTFDSFGGTHVNYPLYYFNSEREIWLTNFSNPEAAKRYVEEQIKSIR